MLRILLKVHSLLNSTQRRNAAMLMAFMVIGMVLEIIGVGLVIPVITLMTQSDITSRPELRPLLEKIGDPSQVVLIQVAMLGLVAIYFTKNIFMAFLAWRQTRFAYGLQAELSQRLFTIYLRQPYTFHLQRNSAQLIRNVTGEVTMFAESVMNALNVATELLVLVGIATLLLFFEPVGAVIVVLVLGGAAWMFYRITRSRIARWGRARQLHDGLRMQHLQQGLGGAKDVKLLGREQDFLARYEVHNVQGARVGQFQALVQMLPRLWLEFLGAIGLAILVLTMLANGRAASSILPTVALFAAAAFRLMPSVNRVLTAIQMLRYGLPVISTLHEEFGVLAAEPTRASVRGPEDGVRRALEDEICLVDVSFVYPDAPKPALDRLAIRIRKGETVGFIGPSGSGKSTLVDVILGLLAPTSGQVRVNGRSIQEAMRSWQDQIGYVPQSIYLTDDSLRRNIAFGLSDAEIDDTAVQKAIRSSQLEEFVGGQPEGIDAVVGERGIRLSGGQRQRIGIARALYHDPGILVLDEATSALDSATERGVMQAVKALHGSKTILIVAHRLSTVAHCDRIYRLDHGSIVEEMTSAKMIREASNG